MRDNIEDQIKLVQASTLTTFRVFCPIHNQLRMRSRHYYGWHLKQYSHFVHLLILVGTISFSAYLIFSSYGEITAADEMAWLDTSQNQPTISSDKIDSSTIETSVFLQQLSKLATDETLKTIADQIGPVSSLSSEQTQEEIRDKIETNLAKDSSVLALIADIRNGNVDSQTALLNLSNSLSTVATDSTLFTLSSKLETGLAKDTTVESSVSVLSSRLDEINQKLAGNLSVSVSNLVTSISVTNFPSDYPSTSTERVQDQVGSDYFNKSEGFKSWALRKDYAKTVFSGEVSNPKNGSEIEALRVTVPTGHTYYVYQIILSTGSDERTSFKYYYQPSGSAESGFSKNIIPERDSKIIDFDKKLKTGDIFRLTLEPVASASSTSTATVFYYDLPWAE